MTMIFRLEFIQVQDSMKTAQLRERAIEAKIGSWVLLMGVDHCVLADANSYVSEEAKHSKRPVTQIITHLACMKGTPLLKRNSEIVSAA